jgi:hypothetical protein
MALMFSGGALIAYGVTPKPDERHECVYEALSAAPEVVPDLAPGQKIYGRVEACRELDGDDRAVIHQVVSDAFYAILSKGDTQ